MKIQQISIFLENKPGQLRLACEKLSESGINISTLSLADSKQFGVLRVIVKETAKALEALKKAGMTANVTEVLALEVEDKPGGLARLLQKIEGCGLNVEYMYAFTFGKEGKAVMIFRFDDIEGAMAKIKGQGVNIVESVHLFGS